MSAELKKIYRDTEEKMNKAIEAMEHEFTTLRTGRASLGILDGVTIEAYGQKMNLNQVASLSTPDAHTIQIQPWDPGTASAIEKAIYMPPTSVSPQTTTGASSASTCLP